jgi:hypothetical protein
MRGMMIIFSLGEQFYFYEPTSLELLMESMSLFYHMGIFFSDPLRRLFVCQWRKRKILLGIFILKRKKKLSTEEDRV